MVLVVYNISVVVALMKYDIGHILAFVSFQIFGKKASTINIKVQQVHFFAIIEPALEASDGRRGGIKMGQNWQNLPTSPNIEN